MRRAAIYIPWVGWGGVGWWGATPKLTYQRARLETNPECKLKNLNLGIVTQPVFQMVFQTLYKILYKFGRSTTYERNWNYPGI